MMMFQATAVQLYLRSMDQTDRAHGTRLTRHIGHIRRARRRNARRADYADRPRNPDHAGHPRDQAGSARGERLAGARLVPRPLAGWPLSVLERDGLDGGLVPCPGPVRTSEPTEPARPGRTPRPVRPGYPRALPVVGTVGTGRPSGAAYPPRFPSSVAGPASLVPRPVRRRPYPGGDPRGIGVLRRGVLLPLQVADSGGGAPLESVASIDARRPVPDRPDPAGCWLDGECPNDS